MLKLLKYEWKACARACLPLYGAIILVALIKTTCCIRKRFRSCCSAFRRLS